MSWMWIGVLLILRQVAAAEASVDTCPSPFAISDFARDKYFGTWYEIESTPNPMESGGRCVRFTYKYSDSNTINVEMNMEKPRFGETNSYYGQLVREDKLSSEAKFRLSYYTPLEKAVKDFYMVRYWILDTDYVSYSIAWTCEIIQVSSVPTPRHYVWILGREKTMSKETYMKVEEVLRNLTDIFPRYSLKETIPCSGGVNWTANILTLLLLLIIGRIFSSR